MMKRHFNQAGQAVVEYILMLVVILAIGIGILSFFGRSFNTYAENYFGAYFECLLAAGELPSLGSDENSLCDEFFQSYTLTQGRPPVSGSGYNNDVAAANNNDQSTAPGTVSDSGRSSKGSRTEGSPSSGRAAANSGFTSNLSSRSSAANNSGGSSSTQGRDDESGGQTRQVSTTEEIVYVDGEGVRGNLVPIIGLDDEEKQANLTPKSVPLKKDAGETLSPERVPANDRDKKQNLEPKEEPFGLGDFLRYLIIAVIIVAILVFFGGQVLQFQKSME